LLDINVSGDHDSVVPFVGTQAWVRSLGFPIVDDWRAWHLHGQSAGFVIVFLRFTCFAFLKQICQQWFLLSLTGLQIHYNLLEQHDIRNRKGKKVSTFLLRDLVDHRF
jgi:hypothetical protein